MANFRVGKVSKVKMGEGKDRYDVSTAYLERDAQGWEGDYEVRIMNKGVSLFNPGDYVIIVAVEGQQP